MIHVCPKRRPIQQASDTVPLVLPEAFLQQLVSSCSLVHYSVGMQQDSKLIPYTVKHILPDCHVFGSTKFLTGTCKFESVRVGEGQHTG